MPQDIPSLPEPARNVIFGFLLRGIAEDQVGFGPCRGLLAAEGILLVSTPYRHRLGTNGTPANPYHKQEWQTEEFAALLSRTFAEVTLFGQGLKLKKRRWQLPRSWARWRSRLQDEHLLKGRELYPLPGPRFFGLWQPLPAYLLAVCRQVRH